MISDLPSGLSWEYNRYQKAKKPVLVMKHKGNLFNLLKNLILVYSTYAVKNQYHNTNCENGRMAFVTKDARLRN